MIKTTDNYVCLAGKTSVYLALLVSLFFGTACSGKKGMRQQRIMNNMVYELFPYKSQDPRACTFKLVLREEKQKGNIAAWFKPANYNKLMYYVNQRLNADFKLRQNNREFSPALVYFEPNTKITNRMIVLIAFDNVSRDDESILEFDDNLFNNGMIKFNINNQFNS